MLPGINSLMVGSGSSDTKVEYYPGSTMLNTNGYLEQTVNKVIGALYLTAEIYAAGSQGMADNSDGDWIYYGGGGGAYSKTVRHSMSGVSSVTFRLYAPAGFYSGAYNLHSFIYTNINGSPFCQATRGIQTSGGQSSFGIGDVKYQGGNGGQGGYGGGAGGGGCAGPSGNGGNGVYNANSALAFGGAGGGGFAGAGGSSTTSWNGFNYGGGGAAENSSPSGAPGLIVLTWHFS